MSKKRFMSVRRKNPLHPSALRLQDIHIGQTLMLVRSHLNSNNDGKVYVLSEPYMANLHGKLNGLVVDVFYYYHGKKEQIYLTDAGVIPYESGWSKSNFTVKIQKYHLVTDKNRYTDNEYDEDWHTDNEYDEDWQDNMCY